MHCTHEHNLLKMDQVRHTDEKMQDFSKGVVLILIFGCLKQWLKNEPDVTDIRENVLWARILLIIDLYNNLNLETELLSFEYSSGEEWT